MCGEIVLGDLSGRRFKEPGLTSLPDFFFFLWSRYNGSNA